MFQVFDLHNEATSRVGLNIAAIASNTAILKPSENDGSVKTSAARRAARATSARSATCNFVSCRPALPLAVLWALLPFSAPRCTALLPLRCKLSEMKGIEPHVG